MKICRSDLFYHMAEFHNFDVGDPYNLGKITVLLLLVNSVLSSVSPIQLLIRIGSRLSSCIF